MSFADLPPLPPLLLPGAQDYADRISAASRRVMATARHLADIRYADQDYWQKLDIYLPGGAHSDLPVFCFLHGGAWVNGCKEWMGFMAPPILSLPAIFVAPSYRHAPAARFPAQLDDCADVLAWLHRNIARYGGAPGKIHFGGHSAGGHLAALTTLRPDLLEKRGLPPDVVKACYPVSGVFDLCTGRAHSLENRKPVDWLLADPAQAPAASPIENLAGNRTPFFVSWGTADAPDLAPQARAFVAALRRQPGRVEALELDGYDHWMTNECGGDAAHRWTETVRRWLADGPG
jgi:acetyl esterase/lipase